jgi:hypothetical protein
LLYNQVGYDTLTIFFYKVQKQIERNINTIIVSGKRAVSPIRSVISSVAGNKKDTYLKIAVPDLFYENRKKFKAYCTQVRFYL